jgi:hydrogenase large subunit
MAQVAEQTRTETKKARGKLVSMNWDPITRIVGSLGIYTKIDFENREVAECHSTSSIFRGYSVFMKGKDPRDAHFITSRICGICGDNHCVCSVYTQNMAYGIRPPAMAEWIINLGEAAEYMFDHNIFQDNLLMVDFCAKMVQETNPGVWEQAKRAAAPNADKHGYRTIADIMTALNPFEGEFYRETLQVSRYTREMIILMEGRHVHPSTIYPGGVGTVPTVQLFTDYLTRLMRYCEFMKRCLPLHDDIFDFFYQALPGYEAVGRRRVLLGCWGSFQDPDKCDYNYKTMTNWGRAMYVTPGVVVDDKLVTTDLVDINLQIRILLGSSYYDSWQSRDKFVIKDPLGNDVDINHPWNQTTVPRPQKRDFTGKYSWVMSPRWLDKRTGTHLALDTGGGALARLWATALAGLVDIGYIKATGRSIKMYLPRTALKPEVEFEWKIPKWSNAIERDRARTYFQVYGACCGLYFVEKALAELQAGRTRTWTEFKVPSEGIGCGFHEAVRGVLSHHMVIRNGKIANYHPYPPTPWNANPRDVYGTPGPYEDAVQNTPIFEENGPDKFKGIDIMRAVRSFDPCLPCGVHMYLGNGKTIKTVHAPMNCGVGAEAGEDCT